MSTRAELEAALAKAEADWRRASERLEQRPAERADASAAWARVNTDRRSGAGDRRRGNGDRRAAEGERRGAPSGTNHADAAWEQAQQARREARVAWENARAALDELGRAEKKA